MSTAPVRGEAPTRMRDQMPRVAEWLDALRQEFGSGAVVVAIRNGMRGGTDFHAAENGYEIGHLPPPPSARFHADYLLEVNRPGRPPAGTSRNVVFPTDRRGHQS